MNSFGTSSNQSLDKHMLTISMRNGDKFRVDTAQLEIFNYIKDNLNDMAHISISQGDGLIVHWVRISDVSSMTISRA